MNDAAARGMGHLNFVCVQSNLTPFVSVAQKRVVHRYKADISRIQMNNDMVLSVPVCSEQRGIGQNKNIAPFLNVIFQLEDLRT